MTLSELKAKDVVNTVDGRCIGKPMDLEFDPVDGRVTALVVPGEFSLIQLLRGEKCGIVIPWGNICKIGDDVILVDLTVCVKGIENHEQFEFFDELDCFKGQGYFIGKPMPLEELKDYILKYAVRRGHI